MEDTDFKLIAAKVTHSTSGDFDNYYLHVVTYMNNSAYRIKPATIVKEEDPEKFHEVTIDIEKDNNEVGIREIESPLFRTISLESLGLGEESEFTLDVTVNKDGEPVKNVKVRHTDMSDYERPIKVKL